MPCRIGPGSTPSRASTACPSPRAVRRCPAPRLVILFALLAAVVPVSARGDPVTASFTDSQNRTLLYRYELAEGQDAAVPQGVLLFFHGNNTGTQEELVDLWFANVKTHAEPLGLVPVALASPYTKRTQLRDWHSGRGSRHWYPEDESLVHELLQTRFGGRFQVDHDRVFFWGASQGTCFLNEFVPRFGAHYGGGLLAECGCFNRRNPTWSPPPGFEDRFRVFVQGTTRDFLYPDTLDAYGYWRYTVGLDTRGDLAADGGHCAAGEVSTTDALHWLVHGTGLPEETDLPHMARMSPMDYIVGVSVDEDGALWVVRQPPGLETTLWRSVDRGRTLEPVSTIDLRVHDLDAVAGALFVTHPRPHTSAFPPDQHALHVSTDGGRTFAPATVPGYAVSDARLVSDRHGRIYFPANVQGASEVHVSSNRGASWSPLGLIAGGPYPHERFINEDPIATAATTGYLTTGETYVRHVGTTAGDDWNEVVPPAGERIYSMAWDGDLFWGSGGWSSLHTSTDRGRTWSAAEWPPHAGLEFAVKISALGHGQVFVADAGIDGHLHDQGAWRRIYGSGSFMRHLRRSYTAMDHTSGDVYFSGGHGLFRIDAGSRAIDPLDPPPDADADGIPDPLDRFPADRSEHLDTDGDGVGNRADPDDDGDGVPDHLDDAPLDRRDAVDTDGDGLGDNVDVDDDGDGVLDGLDDFPLDAGRFADADRDGVDDWADDDDDNDGVADAEDAFPLHPGEWVDTDGDGIGDNLDADDDGDGRDDQYDPAPKVAGRRPLPSLRLYPESYAQSARTPLSEDPRPDVVYPPATGPRQRYGTLGLALDDTAFMLDDFGGYARIHVDRNNNRDLTDDGPPALANEESRVLRWVDARYPSGARVPYAVHMYLWGLTADGAATGLSVSSEVSWRGEVQVPGGRRLAVGAFDFDGDGYFSGSRDYVCIDIDGDMHSLASCYARPSAFRPGDTFTLDGQEVRLLVADSGHRVEIRPVGQSVPFFPAASHPDWQGFVRLTNRTAEAGTVDIHAFDDAGELRGVVDIAMPPDASRHFNSLDLEDGNPSKGIVPGVGAGDGDWRLTLSSELDLDVHAYVRTPDGFLTSMHDVARRAGDVSYVPIANPGRNKNQESLLRLVNPGDEAADVTIRGVDDAGIATSPEVRVVVPARGARTYTAADLEAGAEGLSGSFGEGTGKWRLEIASRSPLHAMSLLRSISGHITNLSTPSYEDGGPRHQVAYFPSTAETFREGFVRVVNRSERGGVATIVAYDDSGESHGPATLAMPPLATVHFNSGDLEDGNPAKRLSGGIGAGEGVFHLDIDSELDLDVLAYVRTADGFLTAMHDALHRQRGGIHVALFNPGSNDKQVSSLRLVNPGPGERNVTITAVDDDGRSPGVAVALRVPPNGARTYTSQELESGIAPGLSGAFGDGTGKWRLAIDADGPLRAMSLMTTPTGHVTNLSTARQRSALVATPPVPDSVDESSLSNAPEDAVPPLPSSVPTTFVTERFGTVHFDRTALGTYATPAAD